MEKVFFRLLTTAVFNSFIIIYAEYSNKKCHLLILLLSWHNRLFVKVDLNNRREEQGDKAACQRK